MMRELITFLVVAALLIGGACLVLFTGAPNQDEQEPVLLGPRNP